MKQIEKYFAKYPYYNGFVHILVGIGIGILITRPFIGDHPVRWAVGFIIIGILGHLYPIIIKSK